MARGGPKKKAKSKSTRLMPAEQHTRFVDAAKNAEADESLGALDKAFKKINPRVVTTLNSLRCK
jgi:hypothetical protein